MEDEKSFMESLFDIRAAAESGSSSPIGHDPQPAADAVPIPGALLLPDAIKGPYGGVLRL